MQNYLFIIGAIRYNSQVTGTCNNVFNPVQNRVLMAHQLSPLEGMLMPLFKSTMMSLKIMRTPVINEQHMDWINLYKNKTLKY